MWCDTTVLLKTLTVDHSLLSTVDHWPLTADPYRIQVGDVLLKIDGEDVKRFTIDEAVTAATRQSCFEVSLVQDSGIEHVTDSA